MPKGERAAAADPARSYGDTGEGGGLPPSGGGSIMSRLIAFVACGFTLAACSASLPSMDYFRSAPPTEMLRIESEPPGADARTSQGQNCRTPCELTVQAAGELSVTVALNGYQTQVIAVKPDLPGSPPAGAGSPPPAVAKLAPNPVYAELQLIPQPPPAKKKSGKKKRVNTVAAPAQTPLPAAGAPAPAAVAAPPAGPEPASATAYPWPTR